jgi:hypothetical protein
MRIMWLTTRAGVLKQRIMERHADDLMEAGLPKTVTLNALDGSQVEVYSRKQGVEMTTLFMKVYMICMVVLTWFVMRSALV